MNKKQKIVVVIGMVLVVFVILLIAACVFFDVEGNDRLNELERETEAYVLKGTEEFVETESERFITTEEMVTEEMDTEIVMDDIVDDTTDGEMENVTEEDKGEVPDESLYKMMYAKEYVPVRLGPDLQYDTIDALGTNQKVYILEEHDDWYKVKVEIGGTIGYVPMTSLSDKEIIINENDDNNEETVGGTGNTDDGGYYKDGIYYYENGMPSVPITPEPTYASIVYELPKDGWYWNYVDVKYVWDGYEWWYSVGGDYPRTEEMKKEIFDIAETVYPNALDLGLEPGPEGEEFIIEKPTIWVYLGAGPR